MEQQNAISPNPILPAVASVDGDAVAPKADGAVAVDAAAQGASAPSTTNDVVVSDAGTPDKNNAKDSVASVKSEQEGTLPLPSPSNDLSFPPWVLNTGFIVALFLAFACLLAAAYYLHQFQGATQDAIVKVLEGKTISQKGVYELALVGQMYLARIQLLSCGIFVGMAFGFLGFALFLLGAKVQMNAEGKSTSISFRVLSISPGVFVLLCSTILIGLCATRTMPFDYNQQPTAGQHPSGQANTPNSAPSNPGVIPHDSAEDVTNKKK